MAKVAFLFPGQGSQYRGMFKEHCIRYPIIKQTFEEASDVLGFNHIGLCMGGSEEELARSYNAQPILLAAGVAAYRLLVQETNVLPDVLAGHSLGEYTALTCSEVLQFADALEIVRQRGRLMQDAMSSGNGQMLAINGLSRIEAEEMLASLPEYQGKIAVACYNTSEQLVLSGTREALQAAVRRLDIKKSTIIPLKVSAAFHSPLMVGAADQLAQLLQSYKPKLGLPRLPVISNVTVEPYGEDPESIILNLVRQMTEPVRWMQTMTYLHDHGIRAAVDIGPNRTIKNLFRQDFPMTTVMAFDIVEEHEQLLSSFLNQQQSHIANHRILSACLAAAVATRNQNEDLQAYELGVVKPYREIEEMLQESERKRGEASEETIHSALQKLLTIMQTKQVSKQEQRERFNQILSGTTIQSVIPPIYE